MIFDLSMATMQIIFVPGEAPKPEAEPPRELLWRTLMEGVRRAAGTAKRETKFSERNRVTSRRVLQGEAEFTFQQRCAPLALDADCSGKVQGSAGAAAFLEFHDCRMILQPATDTVEAYKTPKANSKVLGPFHFTC